MLDDNEIFSGVYNVGDSYYQIVFRAFGEKSSHDIALHMLYSVQLNRAASNELSGSFSLDLSGGVYTNQSYPVVSMPCPDGWQPAESLRFTMPESILSMSTSDGLGTITVRCYSKEMIEAMSSIFIYDERMQLDLISRGLIKERDIPSIQTIENEDERPFTVYPSDIIIIHFDLEDDYGYYCVEMMYTGDDPRVYSQMLTIGQGIEMFGE
ncbi:MAG: hypothetical protein JXN65_10215 [Clostridia bacterium]|nr:hypothetical protein [Clostridia bacterium]